MYTGHEMASYIINWCHANNIAITNLKLQKLLYFVQGENCRFRHKRLISSDFYAWQLGPVIPEVYFEYAMYSSSKLPKQQLSAHFSSQDRDVINHVLTKYGARPTWELVDLSHSQDPWKYNYQIFGDKSLIPYKSIESYFEGGEPID